MNRLSRKYEEYKKNHGEFQAKRRALLKEPEEKLHGMAEDLNVYKLRQEVETMLSRAIKKAWRLYGRIYSGSPTEKDIDTFLELADEIVRYEEFISADQIKVWKVSRDLVWAYKTAFKGTRDEHDQQAIQ